MSPKLNVADIVKKHLATLYDAREEGVERVAPLDLIWFFVVPLIPAVLVPVWTGLSGAFLGTVTTLLGIFAALLFNLLVLTLGHANKLQREVRDDMQHAVTKRMRLRSTQELLYNISFEILISLVAVVFALVAVLMPADTLVERLMAGLLLWLVGVFVAGLFMVLKRVHALVVNVLD